MVLAFGSALETAHYPDAAMQAQDVLTPRTFMQTVHVLRDEREAWGAPGKRNQRAMAGVRLRFGDNCAPPVVPFPHEFRISRECAGRGKLFRSEVAPQATCSAERRYPAFGGDSGSGQYRKSLGDGDEGASGVHTWTKRLTPVKHGA
jgi:hypothetical protein